MAMNRQSTTPIQFPRTTRTDELLSITSGRAGKVLPVNYIPVLRGDSLSGSVQINVRLAELAKELVNGVAVNAHAWLVPKSAHPQFAGMDEFRASYTGTTIKHMHQIGGGGVHERGAPPFFRGFTDVVPTAVRNSEIFKTLGIHLPASSGLNADILDAISIVDNFRRQAHTSKLSKRAYLGEEGYADPGGSLDLPRAFWLHQRWQHLVPDYEQALLAGEMDLLLGTQLLPVKGLGIRETGTSDDANMTQTGETTPSSVTGWNVSTSASAGHTRLRIAKDPDADAPAIFAEMSELMTTLSLHQMDKVRDAAAYARMMQAMQGHGYDAFVSHQMIMDELMRGFSIPEDAYKQPILLSQQIVPFGMSTRHATSSGALDESVTTGETVINLSLNTPVVETGGVVLIFVEVVPERLEERAPDPWLLMRSPAQLPDALRDTLDPEPIDLITAEMIDASHTDGSALFGFMPRNAIWQRKQIRLGGKYYAPTPGTQPTENRFGVWTPDIIDPTFSEDWYLVPEDLTHYPFADQLADVVDVICRGAVTISGLTQFGLELREDQGEYDYVSDAVPSDDE